MRHDPGGGAKMRHPGTGLTGWRRLPAFEAVLRNCNAEWRRGRVC